MAPALGPRMVSANRTLHLASRHVSHLLAVLAAQSLANIVKTSLGPVGLDKMLVDDVGVSDYQFVPYNAINLYVLCLCVCSAKFAI